MDFFFQHLSRNHKLNCLVLETLNFTQSQSTVSKIILFGNIINGFFFQYLSRNHKLNCLVLETKFNLDLSLL